MQRDQRALHITCQLQLLAGSREHLLDFGQRPFIAVLRQVLVQLFERELLALCFNLAVLEQRDLGLQIARDVLQRARHGRGLGVDHLALLQALGHLDAQTLDIVAGRERMRGQQNRQHQHHHIDRLLQQLDDGGRRRRGRRRGGRGSHARGYGMVG